MFYRFTALIIASSLMVGSALHSQISVTDIDAEWTSVTGGVNVTGLGTSEIRWGITNGQQSGYIFQPAPVVFPVTVDTPFSLGTFTHNNFPIRSSGITGATLTTDFTFLIEGNVVQASMVYDFLHNETPNNGPGNCCNDIVTAVNNTVFSDTFVINGSEYQLFIEGFQVGNGDVLDFFSTVEGQSNSANLVAEVKLAPEVPIPEPSTYLLLASMLALALFARRRSKQRSS